MDSAGACLTVAEFTDSINFPKCRRRKDRSRMVLNARDLCGIMATGDIFSFSGRLLMISPYCMTFAYPFFTFSFVSSCSALRDSNSVAARVIPSQGACTAAPSMLRAKRYPRPPFTVSSNSEYWTLKEKIRKEDQEDRLLFNFAEKEAGHSFRFLWLLSCSQISIDMQELHIVRKNLLPLKTYLV